MGSEWECVTVTGTVTVTAQVSPTAQAPGTRSPCLHALQGPEPRYSYAHVCSRMLTYADICRYPVCIGCRGRSRTIQALVRALPPVTRAPTPYTKALSAAKLSSISSQPLSPLLTRCLPYTCKCINYYVYIDIYTHTHTYIGAFAYVVDSDYQKHGG